jgi:hypothetical protein
VGDATRIAAQLIKTIPGIAIPEGSDTYFVAARMTC